VNLRPIRLLPGVATPLANKRPEDIDFVVVRENTEDFYVGIGGRFRESDRRTLTVERELYELTFSLDAESDADEIAYQIGVISREGAERVIRYAFDLAMRRRKKVTSVDKANVLEVTELWRKVVTRIHNNEGYAGIELEHMLVDNCAMQLIRNPKQFDVLVTTNMFGDILSDEAAMLTGSIGMLPSASLGGKVGMYEPVHGTAPDITGQDKANPLATILSVAMMLRHSLDQGAAADRIEKAVEEVLNEGYRTADIQEPGCKLVGCKAMGQLVRRKIDNG
jgi:3-isopropylmalate dehydrogenase